MLSSLVTPAVIFVTIYVAIFIGAYFIIDFDDRFTGKRDGFTARKTVTFGDESTVVANRIASIISILTLFVLWGAFTGSRLVPIHAPGPFLGETSFTYELTNKEGKTDEATVYVNVHEVNEKNIKLPALDPDENTGFAKDDAIKVGAWRTILFKPQKNDEGGIKSGSVVTKINGRTIEPGGSVNVLDGKVRMSGKGSLVFEPYKGWQMEPIWLPPPEDVVTRFIEISRDGYQSITLGEHVFYSLFRVITGFILGALVGIPLGYAMGLNSWFRGWFDPIVEFMRPVPPLALIPLVIIWAGIWEQAKIILLFLAALWIMTIAARAGVSGVKISKIHAAYSLGASKFQILTRVIVPNSLPEIFTGSRVAMGVCWGTVVAAELVAAEKGVGKMIIAASKFQNTDIVMMGIILIGIIGYGIDILMRKAENWLVPWKGK